ncbi:mannitol dehydrogenase domain-containing protein [Gautieria morchelliformis]|nr:mannitol dehydrogenase domain-containing protein [Gautieria morchelliformis]
MPDRDDDVIAYGPFIVWFAPAEQPHSGHNMTSARRALHFGAGNIGRGFIGPLLIQSGYHVVFADIDKKVIDNINEHGEYLVHILDPSKPRPISISDISGVISTSDDVLTEFANPQVDIMTTSVGVGILPRIARTVARGISERRKAGCGPINIIACENAVGATGTLAKSVDEYFSDEDRAYAKANVGFANCAVDRIVPPFKNDSVLDVGVEGFSEWIVDKGQLKNLGECGTLQIEGMLLTEDLQAYVERKLFTLNTGHAITAYLGTIYGYSTIYESIQNDEIVRVVRGAMHESGAALLKKHPAFTQQEHREYVDKIEARFRNPNISDDVKRVGREPLRKLSRGDRLLGPAYMACGYGLPIDDLARGIAAALLYENQEDPQAVELRENVTRWGGEKAIVEVTGFAEGSVEYRKVWVAYQELEALKSARA